MVNKSDVLQFLKFGIVGASNTIVYLAIYYAFILLGQDLYIVGNVVGWIVSVLNAFYWSNRFVFACENDSLRAKLLRLSRSYITYGATFLLSTILLYLEVGVWGWSSWVAPLVNLLVTVPLNFVINKFWTFK